MLWPAVRRRDVWFDSNVESSQSPRSARQSISCAKRKQARGGN
jgi:hypothetical protein